MFKVALFDKWVVVLCGTKNIDEVRKRPEEDFSPRQAALEVRFTLARFLHSPSSTDILR